MVYLNRCKHVIDLILLELRCKSRTHTYTLYYRVTCVKDQLSNKTTLLLNQKYIGHVSNLSS